MTETEYRWVYRMGFGWVERPVVVVVEDEEQDERESARAA